MKRSSFIFVTLFLLLVSGVWGQAANQPSSSGTAGTQAGTAPQSKASGSSAQRQQHRQHMQAMQKEHMEAMKGQLQKLHTDLDQMKASVDGITEANEKARWQANVDMWQTMVGHLDPVSYTHLRAHETRHDLVC